MKRFIAVTMASLIMAGNVFAAEIRVKLDNEAVEFNNQSPLIVEGRTLIPLRGVFEKLGYEITWEAETKTATFTKDGLSVKVAVNEEKFTVNDESVLLDVPAQIINGSMMLPLRAIGEAAGLEVNWDSDSKTVSLVSRDTEASTEVTTEETTEKPEETTAKADKELYSDISKGDIELLRSAARCYVTCYFISVMMSDFMYTEAYSSYKLNGSLSFSYSGREVKGLLDDAISECKKYKNAASSVKTGKLDNKVIKAFIGYADACINDYEFLKECFFSNKYDGLSEAELDKKFEKSEDLMYTAFDDFTDALYEAAENAGEIAKTNKYNAPDPDKLSKAEKEAKYSYNKEIAKVINDSMSFLSDSESAIESPEKFINASSEIKKKLNTAKTPDICVLDREVMLICCELIDSAGQDIKKGAFRNDDNNEEYIDFICSMITADTLFSAILEDEYVSAVTSDDERISGDKRLEDLDGKLI
ncbi:MAG: copper amine oxidase N-terminal domain-containing protein [Clostridia bacterium]|nr:copper amine oxidase N-terminal domain-containing protein [Clostridia bacterium]